MAEALTSTIEFQMSLLLFVALAGYLLASRINQSAVIGEILVGLLIGPSLLGLITYTDFVRSVAHLGAVILLFVIGLEFRLKDIFNVRYSIIALVGVIVPWIGGYYLAKLFGYEFGSAVFVGTALTATSIAITANVLREMGKLQTDAAKAIIGAAVIDDVLSLLALSVSEQMVAGTLSLTGTSLVIFNALAFLVVGSYVGYKFLSRIVAKVDETNIAKKFPEFVFIFAMMIAFLYAMVAELIHLSAIVGSFIAGVSIGGVVLRHSKDYREGAEYLHIIFASIFFVSLGILADFHALTANVVWFLIALTVVAVLTKVIGCYIPAKLQGMSHQDSFVVGFGMSPRGEVAMIVALLGLNAGLIGQDIYVSLVLMSLLTTILTPIVLRNWLYKKGFTDIFKRTRVTAK
ncbi:cation:proton antiporter [Candidatus Woesearchaeota archaeon]|nr:cation:proton antiporter [Candidatus Woesearchaeota archaeon]